MKETSGCTPVSSSSISILSSVSPGANLGRGYKVYMYKIAIVLFKPYLHQILNKGTHLLMILV